MAAAEEGEEAGRRRRGGETDRQRERDKQIHTHK